jgi:hypothetical protein
LEGAPKGIAAEHLDRPIENGLEMSVAEEKLLGLGGKRNGAD